MLTSQALSALAASHYGWNPRDILARQWLGLGEDPASRRGTVAAQLAGTMNNTVAMTIPARGEQIGAGLLNHRELTVKQRGRWMDFSFTEEQTMLHESIERFVQNDYSFDDRQKHAGVRPRIRRRATGTPLQSSVGSACRFSEADGGFGGGAVESSLMMEQFGHGLVIEPYLATVVLAGGAIKHGGSEAQKTKLSAWHYRWQHSGGPGICRTSSAFQLGRCYDYCHSRRRRLCAQWL